MSNIENIIIMAFTKKGFELGLSIEKALVKKGYLAKVHKPDRLYDFTAEYFRKGNGLIFVGAAGIAVRAIGPLLKDKTTDPAVIVVDELGKFVIPILSGHMGRANELAEELAAVLGAVSVITTATDINNVFAVDIFAAKNGYAIENPGLVKYISGALLAGRKVSLCGDFEIERNLPVGIELKNTGDLGIYAGLDMKKNPFNQTLRLIPKCFHIGLGARKNIPFDSLESYFLETLEKYNIPLLAVASISSIDIKKDEKAFIRLSETYDIKFSTHEKGRLEDCQHLFPQSEFVREKAGVGNVCGASAYISAGEGEIILEKASKNGITIAIVKAAWKVSFEGWLNK